MILVIEKSRENPQRQKLILWKNKKYWQTRWMKEKKKKSQIAKIRNKSPHHSWPHKPKEDETKKTKWQGKGIIRKEN